MTIFDSHCHPQFPQYDVDREEMIKRNLDKGVSMIAVGADLKTSLQAIELANRYDPVKLPNSNNGAGGIWATVGLHPTDAESGSMNQESWIELLKQPKVVAVGEVGLDYHRTSEPEKQEKQKEVFKQFLDLAIKYDKPIVLHVRDSVKGSAGKAHSDMLSILDSYFLLHASRLRGVAHSFTGSIEEAQKYLDLGFYLGLNGIITFTKEYDEMIKNIPLDRILIETDAPWLTPEPHRGKRNEPFFVTYVVDKLGELKGLSREEIISQTNKNCFQLFGLAQ